MGIGLFVYDKVAETTSEHVFTATIPFFVPLLIGLATNSFSNLDSLVTRFSIWSSSLNIIKKNEINKKNRQNCS